MKKPQEKKYNLDSITATWRSNKTSSRGQGQSKNCHKGKPQLHLQRGQHMLHNLKIITRDVT